MIGFTASHRATDLGWTRWLAMVALLVATISGVQAVQVTTFNSTDVPVTIPETPAAAGIQRGRTESTIQVAGIRSAITTVTVSVYLTHQWPQDLVLTLIPPGAGGNVILADRIGGSNRSGGFTTGYGTGTGAPPNGRVIFDDASLIFPQVNPGVNQAYILSGTYRSDEPLSVLAGRTGNQVNGTWTLRVDDEANEDQGSLRAWSITITEPGAHIWTGEGTTTNWSEAANWEADNAPSAVEVGAVFIFPDSVPDVDRVATNNVGNISTSSLTVAGGYTIDGAGGLRMTAGSSFVVVNGTTSDTVDWQIGLALAGAVTVTSPGGSTLDIAAVISNDGAGVGAPTFNGVGNGSGTVVLTGANSYTGVTTITSGIVAISTNTGLGTAAGATTVASGATLRVDAGITTTEPLTLAGTGTDGQGALAATATTTWGGPITLSGTNTGFGAAAATTLTIADMAVQAAGSYGFTAIGPGAVTLGDVLPDATALATNSSVLTVTAAQPDLSGLSLSEGTIVPTGTLTVSGGISVSGGAAGSTIGAGTINLGGGNRSLSVSNGTAATDLTINTTTFTAGSLTKGGTGAVLWNNSVSTGVGLNVSQGDVSGSGTVGSLTVGRAKFAPTGVFNVTNVVLSDDSWLAFTGSRIEASGSATIGGGILQPFANGTVIATGTGNSGTFQFYPAAPVNYTGGDGNDVTINIAGGATASFTTDTYQGEEGGPAIDLALTSSGAMTVAIVSGGGQFTPGADFVTIPTTNINGATTVSIDILDDFLQEGTETGQIIIIPLSGGVLANPGNATLTIADNDKDDQHTCGFGTGLTVFLLLGFALAFRARLRRS